MEPRPSPVDVWKSRIGKGIALALALAGIFRGLEVNQFLDTPNRGEATAGAMICFGLATAVLWLSGPRSSTNETSR